jgi:PadR family transcriptional regulator PadR
MSETKKGTLLQGSLDLLVLQSLKSGAMHGYAIARQIKERSRDYLQVEEGSLYPALHRMEQRGWIVSHWGTSESNRRAKYYELSSEGRKQLKQETEAWKQMSQAINHVLGFQN